VPDRRLLCPSAQPDLPQATIFGIVSGDVGISDVEFLPEQLPVTPELLSMCTPVSPTEVFRFAAPCQGNKCVHFDGRDCQLTNNLVQIVPASRGELRFCAIRDSCRWFFQQGSAACARCSQIVTKYYNPPADLDRAAIPFREQVEQRGS
jgi:hypothetical protein